MSETGQTNVELYTAHLQVFDKLISKLSKVVERFPAPECDTITGVHVGEMMAINLRLGVIIELAGKCVEQWDSQRSGSEE